MRTRTCRCIRCALRHPHGGHVRPRSPSVTCRISSMLRRTLMGKELARLSEHHARGIRSKSRTPIFSSSRAIWRLMAEAATCRLSEGRSKRPGPGHFDEYLNPVPCNIAAPYDRYCKPAVSSSPTVRGRRRGASISTPSANGTTMRGLAAPRSLMRLSANRNAVHRFPWTPNRANHRGDRIGGQ